MFKIAILNRMVNEKVRYLPNLRQVWLKLSRGERTQRRIEST